MRCSSARRRNDGGSVSVVDLRRHRKSTASRSTSSSVSKVYETREGSSFWRSTDADLKIDAGRVRRHRRAERLRQEHAPVVGRGLDAGHRPAGSPSTAKRSSDRIPKVGMVFQTDLLLYWRTIIDNILLPVEIKGWKRRGYPARVDALLEQVGLAGFGEQISERAVGRHASARRHLPRPGAESRPVADGRAVRSARRAHARADDHRSSAPCGIGRAIPCCSSPTASTRPCSSPTACW